MTPSPRTSPGAPASAAELAEHLRRTTAALHVALAHATGKVRYESPEERDEELAGCWEALDLAHDALGAVPRTLSGPLDVARLVNVAGGAARILDSTAQVLARLTMDTDEEQRINDRVIAMHTGGAKAIRLGLSRAGAIPASPAGRARQD